MSVPNTNTFSLQDVVDEINPSTNDLQACFDAANASGFNPNYVGSKDRLSNFRDYNNSPNTLRVSQFSIRAREYLEVTFTLRKVSDNSIIQISGADTRTVSGVGGTSRLFVKTDLTLPENDVWIDIEVEMSVDAPANYRMNYSKTEVEVLTGFSDYQYGNRVSTSSQVTPSSLVTMTATLSRTFSDFGNTTTKTYYSSRLKRNVSIESSHVDKWSFDVDSVML